MGSSVKGSGVAGAPGGADAIGGGSAGVADFGCHFLRSGTGGASVGEGCGLAGEVAMGCSSR